jgi:hypothetical protein
VSGFELFNVGSGPRGVPANTARAQPLDADAWVLRYIALLDCPSEDREQPLEPMIGRIGPAGTTIAEDFDSILAKAVKRAITKDLLGSRRGRLTHHRVNDCPSSGGLGQAEVFAKGGSGSVSV